MMERIVLIGAASAVMWTLGAASWAQATEMTWVAGDEPRAMVVTADDPYPIATYAAEELVYHVELATGVTLPIRSESEVADRPQPRIYVGQSNAAREHGIDHRELASEQCVIRSINGDLFIVGNDGPGEPLDTRNTHAGTLWGVYEVLERTLGVRWLWPGELGVDLERRDRVTVGPWDETIKPDFVRRHIRTGMSLRSGEPHLVGALRAGQRYGLAYSSDEALKEYIHDQDVFLRRHRVGRSDDPRPYTGHSFRGWWQRYGEEHPEWFQKLPEGELADEWRERFGSVYGAPRDTWDGRRGPANPDRPSLVSMCVSNPGFHERIIERWQEQRENDPEAARVIRLGENDITALCTCADCLAWDAEQPTDEQLDAMPEYVRRMYVPFDAGRRYAIFWKRVHEMASAIDPDVVVTAFVYINYFVAPEDLELHENIVLSFVPWGAWWFPRDPREQQWLRQQWHAWRDTGATLYYRPNYLFDGASMPHVFARQMAEELQYFHRHGSIGTDFDTLTGQWAANSTTLYLLCRLHSRPDAPVEQLLDEYYAAFGPAAMHVKAYFDFWEAHTTANRVLQADALRRHNATRLHTYARAAHELYPPASFDRAAAILDKARDAVNNAGDERYRQRVDYLADGLTHARKVAELAALFDNDDASDGERRRAVEDLVAFRRSVEHLHIANFTRAARSEVRSWGDRFDFDMRGE